MCIVRTDVVFLVVSFCDYFCIVDVGYVLLERNVRLSFLFVSVQILIKCAVVNREMQEVKKKQRYHRSKETSLQYFLF